MTDETDGTAEPADAPPEDPNPESPTNAWSRTLDELWAMNEDLEADGWDTVAIPSGHTALVTEAMGETDREGFVFVVPGDRGEEFEDAFERGEFDEYEVFRQEAGRYLYLIVRVADTDREIAVLLAGGADMRKAEINDAIERLREGDEIYTHVQLLDATHLGSFRHEDPSLFIPDYE